MDARGANLMLIGIEGYWSTGKSTVGTFVAEQTGALYIPEPDHLPVTRHIDDLDLWYRNAFLQQHRQFPEGRTIITDRTPVSVAAFMQAMGKHIDGSFAGPLQAAQRKYDMIFVLPMRSTAYDAKYDPTPFVRDPDFMSAYKQALQDLLDQSGVPMYVLPQGQSVEVLGTVICQQLMERLQSADEAHLANA